MSEDECPAVVADIGSKYTKVGFSGDDEPKSIFPTVVGRPPAVELRGSKSKQSYVGDEALLKKDQLGFNYPVKNGLVTNWDDIEEVWYTIFHNELRVKPQDKPVLLSEVPMTPKHDREKMIQLLFEKFEVPAYFAVVQGVLSMYASGRITGVSLDSGEGTTDIVPVYEGYALLHAIERVEVAGRAITDLLQRKLNDSGHGVIDCGTVAAMKEALCYVAPDFSKESATASDLSKTYTLPDNTNVVVGKERFQCPEALFKPALLGQEQAGHSGGVHEIAYQAVQKCEVDTRKELFKNIVLSGGTTMLPGFSERLSSEITGLAPSSTIVKVLSPPERKLSVWIGGAILSSLSTFDDMWITKAEYEERGPNVVNIKCV